MSEYIFSTLDMDSNQALSREEFLGFCKTCPEAIDYFARVDELKTVRVKPPEQGGVDGFGVGVGGGKKSQPRKFKGRPDHPPFNAGATGGIAVGRSTLSVPNPKPGVLSIDIRLRSPKLSPIPPNGTSPTKRSKKVRRAGREERSDEALRILRLLESVLSWLVASLLYAANITPSRIVALLLLTVNTTA